MNSTLYNSLSKYEKIVFDLTALTQGTYWTKTYDFGTATAYYSDPITDFYWTLVTQITADESSINDLLIRVDSFFKDLGKEYSFYVYPADRTAGLEDLLRQRNLKVNFEDNWMFYSRRTIDPPQVNPEIHLKEVATEADIEVYTQVYTKAYQTDPNDVYFNFDKGSVYQDLYRKTWNQPEIIKKVKRYIAYYQNQPGAIGALYFGNGIGYLSELGTDPMFRRKGLATALTKHRVQEALEMNSDHIFLGTETDSTAYKMNLNLDFESKLICRGWGK